jgi:hypothetical protein
MIKVGCKRTFGRLLPETGWRDSSPIAYYGLPFKKSQRNHSWETIVNLNDYPKDGWHTVSPDLQLTREQKRNKPAKAGLLISTC